MFSTKTHINHKSGSSVSAFLQVFLCHLKCVLHLKIKMTCANIAKGKKSVLMYRLIQIETLSLVQMTSAYYTPLPPPPSNAYLEVVLRDLLLWQITSVYQTRTSVLESSTNLVPVYSEIYFTTNNFCIPDQDFSLRKQHQPCTSILRDLLYYK